MAESVSDNDVTPAGEETLDFDDDTLRGEKKHVTSFFTRLQKATSGNINPPVDSAGLYRAAGAKHNPFPKRVRIIAETMGFCISICDLKGIIFS